MLHSAHMDAALKLAKEAGGIMRKNFSSAMKKEWKHDNTPVTETDLQINDLVLKELKEQFPTHSILSEEGSDFDEKTEYVWICDPVDGTHNFSHGIPTATFALALTHNGDVVLGVIYDPWMERLFSAEIGKGAHLNGKRLHVSKNTSLKGAVIGLGKMKKLGNLFPPMEAMYDRGASLISGLSIHYMNALVAAGEFSGAIFGGPSVHDMAPAKIIVEEAGGTVTDLWGGKPGRYDRDIDGQVCSNGILHEEMLKLLNLARK